MDISVPEISLVVLVGASGSGKSTFAARHFSSTEVLSSDNCPALVADHENDQTVTKEAFEVLHFIARKRLEKGRLVVVDATNVQPEARKPLEFIARGRRGWVQPAVKCRGSEYLRIIYGPEYLDPDKLERLRSRGLSTKRQRARIKLIQGSLTYRDNRLAGFDAATIVEVIEHMDPDRLDAFERVVFEFAKPGLVVVTTPNVEYNVKFEGMQAGQLRHSDHRFEWTRPEFQSWAQQVADRFGYQVSVTAIGEEDPAVGAPTQMAVLRRVA